jgi:hypothetical protein
MYMNFMLMSYSIMFKRCHFEMNEGNTCLVSYPGSKKHRTEVSICVPRMFNHTHSNNMINR